MSAGISDVRGREKRIPGGMVERQIPRLDGAVSLVRRISKEPQSGSAEKRRGIEPIKLLEIALVESEGPKTYKRQVQFHVSVPVLGVALIENSISPANSRVPGPKRAISKAHARTPIPFVA